MLDTVYAAALNLATGIAGAAAAVFALRRKLSADNTEIVRDRTEATLMATLLAERDTAMQHAREAWSQRTEDAKHIAACEARMEAREREMHRLRDELFALRLHTRKLTSIIVRLDPQGAHMMELDKVPGDGIDTAPGDLT